MKSFFAFPRSNHAEGVYIIKPQAKYTPTRDDIQGRLAAPDDIRRTLCVDDMPSLRLG